MYFEENKILRHGDESLYIYLYIYGIDCWVISEFEGKGFPHCKEVKPGQMEFVINYFYVPTLRSLRRKLRGAINIYINWL